MAGSGRRAPANRRGGIRRRRDARRRYCAHYCGIIAGFLRALLRYYNIRGGIRRWRNARCHYYGIIAGTIAIRLRELFRDYGGIIAGLLRAGAGARKVRTRVRASVQVRECARAPARVLRKHASGRRPRLGVSRLGADATYIHVRRPAYATD